MDQQKTMQGFKVNDSDVLFSKLFDQKARYAIFLMTPNKIAFTFRKDEGWSKDG